MITPKEAAREYGFPRQLLYRLIYTHKLKAQKKKGRWLIKESDLFRFSPERSVVVAQVIEALRSLEALKGQLEGILEAQVNQEVTLRKLTLIIDKNGDEKNDNSNIIEGRSG